ncbi:MAG: PhoX family protein [Acidimicrobiia bacterium]
MPADPPPPFGDLLERRLGRRQLMANGVLAAAGMALRPRIPRFEEMPVPISCGTWQRPRVPERRWFTPVTPGSSDAVVVPPGYRAEVLLGWGDPLVSGLARFDPAKVDVREQEQRFGYNSDFLAVLPFRLDSDDPDRAILFVNHEYTTEALMFPAWDPATATEDQVSLALGAHGTSVVELARRSDGRWSYRPDSRLNRRVTGTTPILLSGPAAGDPWLRTRDDPSGRWARGTLNNCGGGVTPWGTVLSAEENFDQYFTDPATLPDGPERRAHLVYAGESENRGWQLHHPRFDLAKEPREPFRFGWIVEFDPYDPESVPVKRTALGRLKHEAAATVLSRDRRAVVYTGDDEVYQHVYKFVSDAPVSSGRWRNRTLLEHGVLHAASFEADGTGAWLPLTFGTGRLVPPAFSSQADVLVRTREAASAVGATPMDRPEDIEPAPGLGRVYLAMTNNSERSAADNDAANPRASNRLGHVIELIEADGDPGATSFSWEILLLCGLPERLVTDLAAVDFEDPASSTASYFAGYGDQAGLSPIAAPDNLLVDGDVLWIATDGQADPRRLGHNDALHAVVVEGTDRGRVRQFLSAPVAAEVTGPTLHGDGSALFASIQHPGEGSDLTAPSSHWPDGNGSSPRPSVIVVTRQDGGRIGA